MGPTGDVPAHSILIDASHVHLAAWQISPMRLKS